MTDHQRQFDSANASGRTPLDDIGASRFIEAINAERLALAKSRFGGADPTLTGPSGIDGQRIVARILAADREGALVKAGDDIVNPAEDRAEASLQRAINAVGRWQFDNASRDLGEVSALSRLPSRQQRASMIRAMMRLIRALIWTVPGERLRPEDSAARSLLERLDILSDDETNHYRHEVERLTGHWRAAESDDEAWRAWALLRGRIAMRDGADESTAAWALRAWERQPAADRESKPEVEQLLSGARSIFARLAGNPVPDDEPEPPHPRDVLLAVASTLAARTDDPEPFSMTRRFSLVPWYEQPTLNDDEAAL